MATVILMAIVLIAVGPSTARVVAFALLFSGIVAISYGVFSVVGALDRSEQHAFEPGQAFSLKAALLLAATLFLILALSAVVTQHFGTTGLIPVIEMELFHKTVPQVAAVALSFEVLGRITLEQARDLIEKMNDQIIEVVLTPK